MSFPLLHWLNSVSSDAISNLWRATWQGGIFVAIAWILCRLLVRVPQATKNWIWWIACGQVLVRLVCAASLPLAVLPAKVDSFPVEASSPIMMQPQAVAVPPIANAALPNKSSVSKPRLEAPSPATLLMLLWLSGVLAIVGWTAIRVARAKRMVSEGRTVDEAWILDLVNQLSGECGMASTHLIVSSQAKSPLAMGIWRPTIVLPEIALTDMERSQVQMALAHELAHIRRKDLLTGLVPGIATTLFFFHPLVWLASTEFCSSREAACDAEAIHLTGGSAAAYARLLLDTAQRRASVAALGTAIGYRSIQRRISMLTSVNRTYSKSVRFTATFITAAAIVLALPWTVTAQSAHKAKSTKLKPAPKSKLHKSIVAKSSKVKFKPVVIAKAGKAATAVAPIGMTPTLAIHRQATSAPAAPSPVGATAAGGFALNPTQPGSVGAPAPTAAGGFSGRGGGGFTIASPAASTLAPTPDGTRLGVPTVAASISSPSSDPTEAAASKVVCDGNMLTIDFEHVEIHAAIRQLATAAHQNYVIHSNVEKDYVTMKMDGVPFELALNKLLSATKQSLTTKFDSSVWTISP